MKCRTQRLGSDYGGWEISADHQPVSRESVVYSFGIGEDISFDLAMIDAFGATVHAFDPTPRSLAWIGGQQLPPEFIMHGDGIANYDGTARFHAPENPAHVSHTILDRPDGEDTITVPVKTLSTIMNELGHSAIDILKMDIEGAEYDVIDWLAGTDIRPIQCLIEFHHRFPDVGVPKTRDAIAAMRTMGYRLFDVSPAGIEMSFIHGPSLA